MFVGFNPLQRGEPATRVVFFGNDARIVHVSIPSNAGNYLPRSLEPHVRRRVRVSIPSNAGNYLPPARLGLTHPRPGRPCFNPLQRGELPATNSSFNPLQRGELPATPYRGGWREDGARVSIPSNAGNYLPRDVPLYDATKLSSFQSPPTRGTTCHVHAMSTTCPSTTVSIPSNAGNYLPRGLRPRQPALPRAVSIPSNAGNYLPLGDCYLRALGGRLVSIPSNAGNYLPLGRLTLALCDEVSIPSNAGNYLPLHLRVYVVAVGAQFQSPPTRGTTCHKVGMSKEFLLATGTFQSPPTRGTTCHPHHHRTAHLHLVVFQSPPTRGTTCHHNPDGAPVVRLLFQSPPTRGTTCHVREMWRLGVMARSTFQSPPTRGTTCHLLA